MAQQAKREKTKTPNIYRNLTTKKYDVKYNFKVYDPIKGKNTYHSKWKYGLRTMEEAKAALVELSQVVQTPESKDITLADIYDIWKLEAASNNYSVITFRNTEQQMNMIYQFLPPETKLKNITADVYNTLILKCRQHGYAEETLHNINACLRKMLNLADQRDIIRNPLAKVKNKRFEVSKPYEENSPKIITNSEFKKIEEFFENNSFYRLGVDTYVGYYLMVEMLWYTGVRIGELLALQYQDVRAIEYKDGKMTATPFHEVVSLNRDRAGYTGYDIRINKVFLTTGKIAKYEEQIRTNTKNKKNRVVPIDEELFVLVERWAYQQGYENIKPTDRIFNWTQGNSLNMIKKACRAAGIQEHTCHDFRHSFISKLLASNELSIAEIEKFSGDTAVTIYSRYAHGLENMREKFDKVVIRLFKPE